MARAAKWVAPNLANATPEFIIDELGNLSAMESQIKKMRAFYKEALLSRLDVKIDDSTAVKEWGPFEGETFSMTITQTSPNRVSTTLLKELHPEIADECMTSKPQLTARAALKDGATNPVVNSLLQQLKDELGLNEDD